MNFSWDCKFSPIILMIVNWVENFAYSICSMAWNIFVIFEIACGNIWVHDFWFLLQWRMENTKWKENEMKLVKTKGKIESKVIKTGNWVSELIGILFEMKKNGKLSKCRNWKHCFSYSWCWRFLFFVRFCVRLIRFFFSFLFF